MTARSFVEVRDVTVLRSMAEATGLEVIELPARAYLRVGNTTFSAELPVEVTA